ncbi:MAG TPA: lipid-binding SYLF domain-containing protein [Vicinamibacterales bacterium]|nr:lipid-binding SYLF domain-containing protein [Vicinamibacterales bacterium]
MKPATGVAAMAFTVVVAAALTAAARSTFQADRAGAAAEQSERAAKAFAAVMQAHGKAIPRDLLAAAKAVVVFPRVDRQAGSSEGSRGVVSRRTDTGWGNPVFVRVSAGSVGPQSRAASTDYFLLLMNDESVQNLLNDPAGIGNAASIAAGPVVGRSAGSDAAMQAAILSYSSRRGLFAGIDVRGIVIQPEDDLNIAVYDQTARGVLAIHDRGGDRVAADVRSFPEMVELYAAAPADIIPPATAPPAFIN